MGIVLQNAILFDLDPVRIQRGELRIDGAVIVERAEEIQVPPGDALIDCGGAVVLPGLVNGHTHLYSALAVGMPPPETPPRDFPEILETVWWCLDRALDLESIEMSARVGALAALRCGTTTLIDHHASPTAIAGSLDAIERGIDAIGLRGVLCYETTDRHGVQGRDAGLAENERYLSRHFDQRSQRFGGLVGAHALFTLEDQALTELVRMAEQFGTGVHIHVAEDYCDEDACARDHQAALIDRLAGFGLLQPRAIFAHVTALDDESLHRVSRSGLTVAHNPRSNMNNAVGYAPVAALKSPVMLGTDGIGADLFAEARAAWFMSRHAEASLTPNDILGMLAAGARRASESLDITLGKLEPDAAADVIITDYVPSTPLTTDNAGGHFLFGLTSANVRHVITHGTLALEDRRPCGIDPVAIHQSAAPIAERLWQRMATCRAST